MFNSTRILVTALALACLSWTLAPLQAQISKRKTEPIKGTVVSIEKAKVGKSYTLKMKAEDDTEYDVPIVPKTQLTVTAETDHGILKPGMTVEEAVAELEENHYVAEKFTVCIGIPFVTQFTPAPEKDRPDMYQMSGKIGTINFDVNDEGGHVMNVQAGGRLVKINYPADIPISLKVADASFIKEGDAVEVDGTIIKSRKTITARTVSVTSAEPIASADYFAAIEDSKKSKTSKSTAKSKSKTEAKSEGETDTPTQDAGAKEADPFGVLKGKKSTKPKAEKSDKPAGDEAKKD